MFRQKNQRSTSKPITKYRGALGRIMTPHAVHQFDQCLRCYTAAAAAARKTTIPLSCSFDFYLHNRLFTPVRASHRIPEPRRPCSLLNDVGDGENVVHRSKGLLVVPHPPKQHPQGVNVPGFAVQGGRSGAGPGMPQVQKSLGRHVAGRAHYASVHGHHAVCEFTHAQIAELHRAVRLQEHIRRLHVAVGDTRSVEIGNSAQDLHCYRGIGFAVEGPFNDLARKRQRAKLRHDVGDALRMTHAVKRNDIRAASTRNHAHLEIEIKRSK